AGSTATGAAPAAVAASPAGEAARPAAPGTAGPTSPGVPPTAEPHGKGVVKRTATNVKQALLIVIGALAALFAVFNSQNVQVHWIFGDAVNTPLILVIAIAFVAGAVIGWIAAKLGGRNRTN
ncbi:MAG: LapA family protein, partial [Solirubrobacteraceae bacterium]